MPTTLGGALLFVFLLVPGMCYVARLERGERPGKSSTVSAFRETVTVVVASVVALSVSAAIFALVRLWFPRHTPDVGRLVRDGRGAYVRAEYAYVAEWVVALVALAVLLAYLGARLDVAKFLERYLGGDGARAESAWWRVFERRGDAASRRRYLVCMLDDGTEVEGPLFSYNHTVDEIDDRQLVIGDPYYMRSSERVERRFEAGCIVLSARDIYWLRVDYLDDAEYERATSRQPTSSPRARHPFLWHGLFDGTRLCQCRRSRDMRETHARLGRP